MGNVTINDFIKQCKELFGEDIVYKATSKDGITFKSKAWSDKYDSIRFNEVQPREFLGKD